MWIRNFSFPENELCGEIKIRKRSLAGKKTNYFFHKESLQGKSAVSSEKVLAYPCKLGKV